MLKDKKATLSTMGQDEVVRLAGTLYDAHVKGDYLPLLSLEIPELDIDTAYRIEKAYVAKRLSNEEIAGFKIALTTKAAQERHGVDVPLAGVLFKSGRKKSGLVMHLSQFKKMLIETEIALVIGGEIDRPLRSVDELAGLITHVMPAIEVPDVTFNGQPRGTDSLAANTIARWIITGEKKEVAGIDLNNLTVTLSQNGDTVNQGRGSDVLGDQYGALLWLINCLLEQGWGLKPGHILMTGSFGNILPGQPGTYVADYGDLGKVFFEII
jgi:2-keto-4-pentenoate hydratase